MRPIRIYPQYALILTYSVRPGLTERYFRYVTSDFLPALERRELYMQNAWHVVYGDAPDRQIEFITEELDTIRQLLDDPEWDQLEDRLKEYIKDYTRYVIPYRSFKIVRTNNGRNS